MLSCLDVLEDEVVVALLVVVVLFSLKVVLSTLVKVLSLEEIELTPTLHEGMTNAVNNAKALKTCLFFITS